MRSRDPGGVNDVVAEGYLGELRALLEPHGITHVGVAPATVMSRARVALQQRIDAGLTDGMQFTFRNPQRSTDPGAAVPGARSIIVAARPYLIDDPADRPAPAPQESDGAAGVHGRIARYAWLDHYAPLREGLWAVARRLRADGWRAVPFADDNSIVDREAAWLGGLGWFGKNANLLLPGAGSWFVLGSVITTAPLPVASATVDDGCGTCRRCLDACPTAAIVAPGTIDAARCLAWVLQKPGTIPESLRAAVGDRMYGCDDCQTVCPPTVRFGSRFTTTTDHAVARSWIDVIALLRSDDEGVLESWGSWYLADRDPRWARRNALVVLGNAATGRDAMPPDALRRVAEVLSDYVAGEDPMLREHALWAADQWGLPT